MTGGDGYGRGGSILSGIFGGCSCKNFWDCDRVIDRTGGFFLWAALAIYMLQAMERVCERYFMHALELISDRLGLSQDTAGVTVLALGTSAPEFMVSLTATFLITNEAAVGTAIGSAVLNILLMTAAVAFFATKEAQMTVFWYPPIRDAFFLGVALAELLIFLQDGEIIRMEAAIMVATYLTYCVYMKFNKWVMRVLEILEELIDDDDGGHWKWGRCPQGGHKFEPVVLYQADEARKCGRCSRAIKQKEVVLQCKKCDPTYLMCGSCSQVEQRARVQAFHKEQEALRREAEAEQLRLTATADGEDQDDGAEEEAAVEAAKAVAAEAAEKAKNSKRVKAWGRRQDEKRAQAPQWGGQLSSLTDEVSPTALGRGSHVGPHRPQRHSGEGKAWSATPSVGEVIKVRTRAGVVTTCEVLQIDDERRIRVRYDRDGSPRGGDSEEWLELKSARVLWKPPLLDEGFTKQLRTLRLHVFPPMAPLPPVPDEESGASPNNAGVAGGSGEKPDPVVFTDPLLCVWREIMPREKYLDNHLAGGNEASHPKPRVWFLVKLFVVAAGCTFCLTYMALDSMLRLGEIIRLPPRAVGLLIVATGTNFSDILGSAAVARSGEGRDVIGNALGLPIFDLLFGLGLPWLIRTCAGKQVVFAEYKDWLFVDLYLLVAVVAVFLGALLVRGFEINRGTAVLFFLLHTGFVLYVLVSGPISIPAAA